MDHQPFVSWIAHHKIVSLACVIFLIELAFRRFAPGSSTYASWTAFFRIIGTFWTAIILSLVYVLSVGPIGLGMRLLGRDPLDRALRPEPTFWRAHDPNPLGPAAAVRHQF